MPYCRKAAFRQPSSKDCYGLPTANPPTPERCRPKPPEREPRAPYPDTSDRVCGYSRSCNSRGKADQAIDLLPDVPVLHPDQPHAANTGAFSVGRFKIDRDEILHKTVKISSQVRCATSAKSTKNKSGTVKRGHPFRKRHAAPYRIL